MTKMTVLERARAKREGIKISQAGRTKAYKFKPGKTVISLLPLHTDVALDATERDFSREYGMHYLKNQKGEFVVAVGDSSLTYGTDCPVRNGLVDMIRYANSIGDEDLAKQAKDALAKKNVLIGVYVHKDTEGKEAGPQLISISESFFDQFLAIIEEYAAEELDAPMRWENRLTFIVEREGTGATDTRYKVLPAAKRMSIAPTVMDSAVNLDEYIKAQFDDSITKALNYIGTVTGKSLAGGSAAAALTGGAAATAPRLAAPVDTSGDEEDDDDLLAVAPPPRKAAPEALASATVEEAEFTDLPFDTATDDADIMAEIEALAA